MGVALGESGSPKRAMEQYRQAVALQPRYPEAHCNMGVIHKQQVCIDTRAYITTYQPL
jgi:Flp pilus assembly protein TadD